MSKPLLLRLVRVLKRPGIMSRAVEPEPADRSWRIMLARLDVEERERRLRAAEAALNLPVPGAQQSRGRRA